MIPEGKYKAKATDAQLGMTSNGTEQVVVKFELLEPPEGYSPPVYMTYYGYFTDKCIDRTLQSLRYTGWKGDDIIDLSTVGSEECEIVIEYEDDLNGEPRARVKWVNRLQTANVRLLKPMNQGQMMSLAARIKGKAMAQRQQAEAQERAAAPAQAAPVQQLRPTGTDGGTPVADDDDIPF